MKSKENRMYMRMRNLTGLMGMLLPWIALFSAGIAERPSADWWWSISATYYQSPALVAILAPACMVLICYIGYNDADNIITTLSGIAGLGIILFPCKVSWIADGTRVGFFQVPVEVSSTVHGICAGCFFLLIALNSIFLFTKSKGDMTDKKKIRNRIYYICGYGMIAVEAAFLLTRIIQGECFLTMIYEILLLNLFGVAWLVKGEAIPFLNDPEEEEPEAAVETEAIAETCEPAVVEETEEIIENEETNIKES